MDLIKLNDPERNDDSSPRFYGDEPLEISEKHRTFALIARANLERKKPEVLRRQIASQAAARESDAAKIYLEQLEGGWGAPLVQVGPATLYEFRLEMPGYGGPVRGFRASTSQTGQIQHVSHVSSKTTSGAGCAALGCLAAGPVGAVAGATMGKKNDVKTQVEIIDNRRFEIQVVGPGAAWSYVGNHNIEESVRSFRDLLLARSTNTDDPKVLAIGQREVVAVKNRSTDLEYMKLQEADDRLKKAAASFESAWNRYEDVRMPVGPDLIARWKRSSVTSKIITTVLGPLFTISWIATIVVAAILKSPNTPNTIAVAILAGIVQLTSLFLLALYYRIEIRLLKTLPSEASSMQPFYRFLDRLLKEQ